MLDGLSIIEAKDKLLLYTPDGTIGLALDIADVGVNHEGNEVENEVCALA